MAVKNFTTVFLIGLVGMLCDCDERTESHTQDEVYTPHETLDQRPNIILIMADDLGWGDTGYSGNPLAQTPNLDAMAAAGTVFERFYAAAPVCSPTRGSVMTGRHPFRREQKGSSSIF